VAVGRDQGDRQVGADEHQQQHGESEEGQQALDDGDAADGLGTLVPAAQLADRQQQLQQRQRRRQPERCEAGFSDHRSSVFAALCSAAWLPSCGGM
jgi:hypothetical protein